MVDEDHGFSDRFRKTGAATPQTGGSLWMGQQRNLSRHTVLSYRDTWKLLLRFVPERKHREITALSLPTWKPLKKDSVIMLYSDSSTTREPASRKR
jgi:hypothetical protein